MYLPRILIIGQPFNNDTGGGITLSNLFNGWNRDKIAVICPGHLLLDNIDTKICNTYYQLGYKENKWSFPFNFLQRKYYSGILRFDDRRFQNLTIAKSKVRVKIIMNYFNPILEFIGLFYGIYKTKPSKELLKWLDNYNPDVIYAQTATRDGILFCTTIQNYLKKPLIFHMMDDWPSMVNNKGFFNKYWQKKIDREFRILLEKASVLMSISDEMAKEYKTRYNKDFLTFHNTIDIDFWGKYRRTNYELSNSPTVLYAGRIGLGIDKSLELVAKAIAQLNETLRISVKLIVQTQVRPSWINNYRYVIHKDFVSYYDLPETFSKTDFLLLPYDFSQKSIEYIRYSMPTKAPEYMISGVPIIIFAPEETAVVKYAKKYGWAQVVTEKNIGKISETIKQLIENKELRQKIGQNAIKMAEKNHNSIDITSQFRKIILSVV
jgi:glycosyltransferase involved in cell wall biosynthesis